MREALAARWIRRQLPGALGGRSDQAQQLPRRPKADTYRLVGGYTPLLPFGFAGISGYSESATNAAGLYRTRALADSQNGTVIDFGFDGGYGFEDSDPAIHTNAANFDGTDTEWTPTWGSPPDPGDILFFTVTAHREDITIPAGVHGVYGSAFTFDGFVVCYRIADGTADDTPTFTFSASTYYRASICSFYSTSGLDAVNFNYVLTGHDAVAPSVTPTHHYPDDVLYTMHFGDGSSALSDLTLGIPTGHTISTQVPSDFDGGAVQEFAFTGSFKQLASDAATGTITSVHSGGVAGVRGGVSFLIRAHREYTGDAEVWWIMSPDGNDGNPTSSGNQHTIMLLGVDYALLEFHLGFDGGLALPDIEISAADFEAGMFMRSGQDGGDGHRNDIFVDADTDLGDVRGEMSAGSSGMYTDNESGSILTIFPHHHAYIAVSTVEVSPGAPSDTIGLSCVPDGGGLRQLICSFPGADVVVASE